MKESQERPHLLTPPEKQVQAARLNTADAITRKLYPDGPKPMVFFSLSTDVIQVFSQPSSPSSEAHIPRTDGMLIINHTEEAVIIYEKISDDPLALQEVTPPPQQR